MSTLQLDESELLDTSAVKIPVTEPTATKTSESVTEPTPDPPKKHKKDKGAALSSAPHVSKKTPVIEKRRTKDGLDKVGPLHVDESGIPSTVPRLIGKRHRRASEGKTNFPFRSMQRLARCGGVKRVSRIALATAMTYADDFVRKTVELAIAFLDSGDKKRQTCRTKDVLQAFRMMGFSLFGAEDLG